MILLRIYMNITAVRTLPASGAEFHCLLLLTGGRFSLSNLCVSLPLSHTHTHRRLQPGSRKKKKKNRQQRIKIRKQTPSEPSWSSSTAVKWKQIRRQLSNSIQGTTAVLRKLAVKLIPPQTPHYLKTSTRQTHTKRKKQKGGGRHRRVSTLQWAANW